MISFSTFFSVVVNDIGILLRENSCAFYDFLGKMYMGLWLNKEEVEGSFKYYIIEIATQGTSKCEKNSLFYWKQFRMIYAVLSCVSDLLQHFSPKFVIFWQNDLAIFFFSLYFFKSKLQQKHKKMFPKEFELWSIFLIAFTIKTSCQIQKIYF